MTPDIKRILVATDFSSSSRRALDYAIGVARKFDASLHLVHVCEVPSMITASMDAYAIAYTDWNQRLGEEAERELAKIAALRIVPSSHAVASSACRRCRSAALSTQREGCRSSVPAALAGRRAASTSRTIPSMWRSSAICAVVHPR